MQATFLDGSTQEIELVNIPRNILWKHGRTGQAFQSRINEIVSGYKDESPEAQGLIFLESMTDEERLKFKNFADDIIKYSTSPQVEPDSLTEMSYWVIFGRKMYGLPDAPIQTTEGETTVEAVETFPVQSTLSEAGEDVPNLRTEAVQSDGTNRPTAM